MRQTNKRSSFLSYTTMNNKHIFNNIKPFSFPASTCLPIKAALGISESKNAFFANLFLHGTWMKYVIRPTKTKPDNPGLIGSTLHCPATCLLSVKRVEVWYRQSTFLKLSWAFIFTDYVECTCQHSMQSSSQKTVMEKQDRAL